MLVCDGPVIRGANAHAIGDTVGYAYADARTIPECQPVGFFPPDCGHCPTRGIEYGLYRNCVGAKEEFNPQ